MRLTLQASQRNKFNLAWDEQDACTNPCKGMINIVDSPESYFSLQNRPNRLRSASWTNPFTNKILFEAGITAVNTTQDSTRHREYQNRPELPRICEAGSDNGHGLDGDEGEHHHHRQRHRQWRGCGQRAASSTR